tara:strand:+ start:66 stop:1982 length:1917 start_codon:yes stop_codon:yes gene_type:complete
MSIYTRRLFNKGGQVSSRGVGITSGLDTPKRGYVDKPGSYSGDLLSESSLPDIDKIGQKYKSNLEMLKSLDIVPERKPFSRLDAAAPALLNLFGGLMSGKSYQGGLGGALDIAGQALQSSTPLFAEAIKAKQEYDAKDPDAALKQTALSLALEKDDPEFEYKVINDRLVKINLKDNTTEVLEDFSQEDLEKFDFKVVNDRLVKVDKVSGATSIEQDFSEDTKKVEYTDPSEVTVEVINDQGDKSQIPALRTFDKTSNEFTYQNAATGETLNKGTFNVVRDQEKEAEAKTGVQGNLVIGDKSYDTTFIQTGKEFFVLDPRPTSDTFGQTIPLSAIDELSSYDIKPSQDILSQDEQIAVVEAEDNIETANNLAEPILQKYVEDGNEAGIKEQKYIFQKNVLESSAFGTAVEQRTNFLRFLKTFGVDESIPDVYELAENLLKVGNVPATEVNIALSKTGVLNIATQWSQQLNKSEFGLIIDSGPKVALTKEGQELLIQLNVLDQQIKRETADIVLEGLADGKAPTEILKEAKEFQDQQYSDMMNKETEIGAELNRLFNIVQGYENIKGEDFFNRQEEIQLDGEKVSLGELYDNDQIKFIGYADPQTGMLEALDGSQIDAGVEKNKPIYAITFNDEVYYRAF